MSYPTLMKSLIIWLIWLTVALLSGCQQISLDESAFLHPDRGISQQTLDSRQQQQRLRQLELKTHDGNVLSGALISVPAPKYTLLYFGGNSFRLSMQGQDVLSELSGPQNNLVIFDHRGYGSSEGEPNIALLKQDALDIFDFLKQHPETANTKVIVHGLSLGSMIAGYLASERDVDGLILEGSTTTAKDMIDANIPWYAAPFIHINLDETLGRIDNAQRLQEYHGPLLIVTGEDDTQTPPALSEKLYQHAASKHKSLLIVPDKRHGNATQSEEFEQALARFIQLVLANQTALQSKPDAGAYQANRYHVKSE